MEPKLPKPMCMRIDGETVRIEFTGMSDSRLYFTSYRVGSSLRINRHNLPMTVWNEHKTDRTSYHNGHSYRFLPKEQEVISEG